MLLRSRLLLPFLVATGFALASCEKEDASPTATTLLDHRWLLQQVDGVALPPATSPNTSYLEFVDLGHCVVGLGPCNNFSSRFILGRESQQLSISTPIPTRATCAAQELENRYLSRLDRTARYEISGPELRLYDAESSTPRLVFRQAAGQ